MRLIVFLFVILMIVFLLMWVMLQNAGHVIEELKVFGATFDNVNLVMVMFVSFATGILMGFIVPVFQYLGARAETRRLRRNNKSLRTELDRLRNVGIEGEIGDMESPDAGSDSSGEEEADLPAG